MEVVELSWVGKKSPVFSTKFVGGWHIGILGRAIWLVNWLDSEKELDLINRCLLFILVQHFFPPAMIWFEDIHFVIFFVGMRYSILAKVSGPPKLSNRWSMSLGETPPFFRFQVLKLGGSGTITQFGRIPGPGWDEITVIALDLSLRFEAIHIRVNYWSKRHLQHLHLLVRNFGGVLWSQRIWIPTKFPRIFFCPKHRTHFCLEHGRVFFATKSTFWTTPEIGFTVFFV